jgi:hypothetical protein
VEDGTAFTVKWMIVTDVYPRSAELGLFSGHRAEQKIRRNIQ